MGCARSLRVLGGCPFVSCVRAGLWWVVWFGLWSLLFRGSGGSCGLSGRGPFCVLGRVSGVGEGVAGVFGRVAGRFCWFSVFFAVCGVSQLGVARCRGLVLGLEWGGEVEVV